MKKLLSMETQDTVVYADWDRVDSLEFTPGSDKQGFPDYRITFTTSCGQRYESALSVQADTSRQLMPLLIRAIEDTYLRGGVVASLDDLVAGLGRTAKQG